MAELKTKPIALSVTEFLDNVESDKKQQDSQIILEIMERVTGEKPQMWGSSIIGFGKYKYKYASGHSGETFLTGFSPRKQRFSLYIMSGFDQFEEIMNKLGKHKIGKACLYINKLADVDPEVLEELIRTSVKHMKETNETS